VHHNGQEVQRKKTLLVSTLCGAAIGALAVQVGLHDIIGRFPALAPDRRLLSYPGFLLSGMAVWALFGIYWEIAAKNAAAARRSESRRSRALHVALVNLALVLELFPIRGLGRFLPVSPPVMAASLAVEVMGLLLAIWARRHLGRNWSGKITIKVEHALIRSGPYRRLRHPIYTGLPAMYLGLALLTAEWLGVIGFALAVLAYWRKIRLEETNLEMAFGSKYDQYRRTSWALVPGIF
jgi:protein-S-isoprenylcysteine O-methyltransferase Ste14